MLIFFLIQNYDIYRIFIKHLTLIESVYVSIRQLCLGLISLGLLCISRHKCHRPVRVNTDREVNESRRLLTDTVIIQPVCPFLPSSLSQEGSLNVINEDSATIAELFTFSWVNPLMKRGYNSLINDINDLCLLPSIMFSSCSILQHHRQLSRSLINIFGRTFFLLGILKILGDGLAFGGPIFLNKLITYMEESSGIEQQQNRDLRRGLLLSFTLIGTVALSSFLNTHFTYRINRLGLRCKMYLYTRIYSKTTQLNLCEMHQFNMGEIVNFMSTDSDRIVNFFQSFHAFWSLPVQIIIVLCLLYQQIGLTFLTGLTFAIILIPINKIIASKIAKLSQDMMLYKDERVKLISEIIYGIRTIKMNTYENYFIERMNDVRQKELRALRGRKYLDAFCVYFWATTPVLISVLTFTTYTLLGNQLTPAKVLN
jgi:ATP-binding cassette subfamily C (CFTR/MRP) protein 10